MARADDKRGSERGGGGGRGRGRGERGRKNDDRETQISKKLSHVLRHGAIKEGLKMDERGFVNVGELLKWNPLRSMHLTFPDLRQIVVTNSKQRYELLAMPSSDKTPSASTTSTSSSTPPTSTSEDPSSPPSLSSLSLSYFPPISTPPSQTPISDDPSSYLIRATQGHSIPIASSSLLQPILADDPNCPAFVVHGTYPAAWTKILASGGLSRMGRGHVHFAPGLPGSSKGVQSTASKLESTKEKGGETKTTKVEKEEAMVEGRERLEREVPEEGELKGGAINATPDAVPVISGMRASASVLVWVDVKKSMREGGLKWWRSTNGVLLTEGDERGFVKLEFVDKAEWRGSGEVVWRNEGKEEEEGK